MNKLEKRMLDILKQGKQEYGYDGIKSEFEAEGVRMDEQLRLTELARKANLKIGIKIGGCEAISDLHKCKLIGADYIIAPMIETSYALLKYIEAKNKLFTHKEQEDVKFLFNLETITAYNNLTQIVKTATTENGLNGIVFGRVDFVSSMGLTRSETTSERITQYCLDIANSCKENKLEFVVGGSVTLESINSLIKIKKTYLTRFETRKVIFNSKTLQTSNPLYLKSAIEFELLALKNKQSYYNTIAIEDLSRIKMLEKRLNK